MGRELRAVRGAFRVQLVAYARAAGMRVARPPVGPLRLSGQSDRGRIPPRHVRLEELDELVDEALATERPVQLAVNEDGSDRVFEGARQRDPDVRVLALAGSVHDTAHHGDAHLLDAW